jgi:hypothetical protein
VLKNSNLILGLFKLTYFWDYEKHFMQINKLSRLF